MTPKEATARQEQAYREVRLLERIVLYDGVIRDYIGLGASGTVHDVEHRKVRADLVAELEAAGKAKT